MQQQLERGILLLQRGLTFDLLHIGLELLCGQARFFGQLLQRLLDLQRLLARAGLGVEPGALDRRRL